MATGSHVMEYGYFGSHMAVVNGEHGFVFRVWAPNAREVMVVGDFNGWDGTGHMMRKVNGGERQGCYQLFIEGMSQGERYKYLIRTKEGKLLYKSDPYGRSSEHTPGFCSLTAAEEPYIWGDSQWFKSRKNADKDQSLNIYEIHLGSWRRREDCGMLNYRDIANRLAPYVKGLGFTHVEVLPITEYPHEPSWGYQATGYYSPTSRYGSAEDFKYFVETLHKSGIGVIMDWVPGHFCKDEHGLYRFDGTALYEYSDPRLGDVNEWGTANFDFSKQEVQDFIISNAMFWLEEYHIDGFRMDAMANTLYLDYGARKDFGLKNTKGGRENLEAEKFIKKLNGTISEHHPGAILISEEPTLWPGSTKPIHEGGLGFTYKWNMGFISDLLKYMGMNPLEKRKNHELLTFSIMYSFSESFLLALSHDEVTDMGKSIYSRIYGSEKEKMAGLRLLYGYIMAHPGKKLSFMGCEFGQVRNWDSSGELDWELMKDPLHLQILNLVRDLNGVYEKENALWELDHTYDGFQWIDCDSPEESAVAFLRKGTKKDEFIIIACNFSLSKYDDYLLTVPNCFTYKEMLNSDSTIYGGSGLVNKGRLKPETGVLSISLAPLTIALIKPEREENKKSGETRREVL